MQMIYGLFVGLLCLFSFPIVVIGILIVMTSGFPVMYRQQRIGKNGKSFVIYKFRSMRRGADRLQKSLLRQNEAKGPVFKIHDDPRLTLIGKFLSHTGLDELPQLYNVVRGEMAIIGPRPLPVFESKKLKPWMRKRYQVLPGIISPAILSGTYHKNFNAWMKSDIAYVKKKNLLGDIRLAGLSVVFLFRLLVRELIKDD